jgi:hypothetical protein
MVALAAGGAIGCSLLLGFNFLVHGSVISPYMHGHAGTFAWADLGEKFVSIFFDSASLYVEPSQMVVRRLPWMALGPIALASCFVWGPLWLRAAVTVVVLQWAAYLSFYDLLPNGFFRYNNLHYLRLPLWLTFLLLPVAAVLVYRRFGRRWWAMAALAIVVSVLLAGLQFRATEVILNHAADGQQIAVDLPSDQSIDYIDFPGLVGDWESTYLGRPGVRLDNRVLQPIYDVRALQTLNGTRLLFIRPIKGSRLLLSYDGWRAQEPLPAPRAGSAAVTFGVARWLLRRPPDLLSSAPVRMSGPLSNLVFRTHFEPFDGSGRQIKGDRVVLTLPLKPRKAPYLVHLRIASDAPGTIAITIDRESGSGQVFKVVRGENRLVVGVNTAIYAAWLPTRIRLALHGPESMAGGHTPTVSIVGLWVEQ